MDRVEAEILILADPDAVYAVAKDIERFPEFMPDVERVAVLERSGDRVVSDWVGVVREFNRKIAWVEEDRWDDGARRCDFAMVSGDWDKYQGAWTFDPAPEGTLVKLALDFELNVPLIGPLIKGLLVRLVRKNCQQMLEGLRGRLVGQSGAPPNPRAT
jgi:ribosome-associated toxin RatA of RatAB toxin-antitoxin module